MIAFEWEKIFHDTNKEEKMQDPKNKIEELEDKIEKLENDIANIKDVLDVQDQIWTKMRILKTTIKTNLFYHPRSVSGRG